jgi:dienelactone hydrolase
MIAPALLALLVGSGRGAGDAERIEVRTEDGVVLAAEFRPARAVKRGSRTPAVLLLHDAGGCRDDLVALSRDLASRQIASLAIDLREHGESASDRPDPSAAPASAGPGENGCYLKMQHDVRAGIEELRRRSDVDVERIAVVGLGFGGSVGLRVAAREHGVRAAVLVSPNPTDRGFDLTSDLRRLQDRALLLVADPSRKEEVSHLLDAAKAGSPNAESEVLVTRAEGRSADLLRTDKRLPNQIADWLRARFGPSEGK